jgi:hypothetical protein
MGREANQWSSAKASDCDNQLKLSYARNSPYRMADRAGNSRPWDAHRPRTRRSATGALLFR